MSGSIEPAKSRNRSTGWVVWALALLCLGLRLPGLMALPIFGDESIYLRWAQLIRGDASGHHWWVSLADPKPPLHFWLIAAVYHWAADPLMAARLISVAAGVACVPLTLWIVQELGYFCEARAGHLSARTVGLMAAILMSICPFLAFYQRLATQDALFTMESMAIVWLSLRWSRVAVFGVRALDAGSSVIVDTSVDVPTLELASPRKGDTPNRRAAWVWSLCLGVAIGAGLLTRQGVSYTICAFPLIAWIMQAMRLRHERLTLNIAWFKGFFQLVFAAVLAAAMWTPYLTGELQVRAAAVHVPATLANKSTTSSELSAEIKRRIFYQDSFMGSPGERLNIASRNMRLVFVPRWIGGDPREPSSGWYYVYMTPTLYGLGIAGMAYLAFRQPRVFIVLLVWFGLLMGPLIFLASTIYSRYALAGVPPLLVAGAWLMGDVSMMFVAGTPRRPVLGAGIALMLWGIVIAAPLRELRTQAGDWAHQTLTARGEARSDRYQYISGWTAGYATRDALAYLQDAAKAGPIVVITTNAYGTPADAMWVYLESNPNVQLFYTDDSHIPRAGIESGTYRFKSDKWLFPPERPVHLASDAKVFFVTNDPVHAATDVPATTFFSKASPNLGPPKTFYGVEGRAGEGVSVFPVSLTGPWPRGRGG